MLDKQAKARVSAAASVSARKAKAESENLSNECQAAAQRTFNGRSAGVELPTPTPTPTFDSRVETHSPQRGSRLPSDWQLPLEWEEWARRTRPDLDIQETANCFADYWHSTPGAKGRKSDWEATWRNWVRKEWDQVRHMPAKPQSKAVRQATDKAWVDELIGRSPGSLPGDIGDVIDAQVVGVWS